MALNNPSELGVIKTEELSFPGFGPKKQEGVDFSGYSVRYAKIDLDNPSSITELEILETRAIRGQGIIILSKDKFTFADRYLIVVCYLEQDRNANTSR